MSDEEYEIEIQKLIQLYESHIKKGVTPFLDSDQYCTLVRHYMDHDKIDEAAKALKAGYSFYPDNLFLKENEIKLLLIDEEYEAALDMTDEYFGSDEYIPDIWLLYIEIYLNLQQPRRAGRFVKAIENDRELEDACYFFNSIADLYFDQDDYQKALHFYKKACKSNPQSTIALENLALCYESLFEMDKAIEVYHKILDIEPYNSVAWIDLSRYHILQNEVEKAIDALDFALTIDTRSYAILSMICPLLVEVGRAYEAIAKVEHFIENNPENIDARMLLATQYRSTGQYAKALAIYDTLLTEKRKNPKSMETGYDTLYANKGYVYMAMNNAQGAMMCYKDGLTSGGNTDYLKMFLGDLRYYKKEYAAAENIYLDLYNRYPGDVVLLGKLAETFVADRQIGKAIHFRRLLQDEDPDHLQNNTNLAILYYEAGMREEFLDTIALLTNEQLYQLVSAFQSPEDARQLLRTRSAFLKRLEELFDKRQLSRNVKL